jgi:hypothetical protein
MDSEHLFYREDIIVRVQYLVQYFFDIFKESICDMNYKI